MSSPIAVSMFNITAEDVENLIEAGKWHEKAQSHWASSRAYPHGLSSENMAQSARQAEEKRDEVRIKLSPDASEAFDSWMDALRA